MFKTFGQRMYLFYQNGFRRVRNEKGAELMEWIGMCLVVIAILGAIIMFFKDNDEDMGSTIADFIKTQIQNLTNPGE